MSTSEFDSGALAGDLERIRARLQHNRVLGETDLGGVVQRARLAGQEDRIRILYADDDERYRLLIEAVLRTYPRFELVGAARNGEEAVALARRYQPDVVLLDVEMPEMDGFTAAREIGRELPGTHILLHTGDQHGDRSVEAHRHGLAIVDKLSIHDTLATLSATP